MTWRSLISSLGDTQLLLLDTSVTYRSYYSIMYILIVIFIVCDIFWSYTETTSILFTCFPKALHTLSLEHSGLFVNIGWLIESFMQLQSVHFSNPAWMDIQSHHSAIVVFLCFILSSFLQKRGVPKWTLSVQPDKLMIMTQHLWLSTFAHAFHDACLTHTI